LVRVRCADLQPKDLLRAWIAHLFACAVAPKANHHTLIVARDEAKKFLPVQDASTDLAQLLDFFATAHTRPLPFFPATSHKYADRLLCPSSQQSKSPEDAARDEWGDGRRKEHKQTDSVDDWNALVWRKPADPFEKDWKALAVRVFGPLLKHLSDASA